jgi:YHS domain-containing protein
MTGHRTVPQDEDPVCGMAVDPAQARQKILVRTHDDLEYVFCGKGCFLEFGDDPETFLAPDYTPAM